MRERHILGSKGLLRPSVSLKILGPGHLSLYVVPANPASATAVPEVMFCGLEMLMGQTYISRLLGHPFGYWLKAIVSGRNIVLQYSEPDFWEDTEPDTCLPKPGSNRTPNLYSYQIYLGGERASYGRPAEILQPPSVE